MPDPHEQMLWELDAAHRDVMDDIALNQRVCEVTVEALGRIAREHYPAMANWQPEQLRALADKISRHACNYSRELSDLDFHGTASP
jgi:predicted urease superfamily metal-dependent hydrolase